MQHFRTNPIITAFYGIITILLAIFLYNTVLSKDHIIHIIIVSILTLISCFAFFKAIFRKSSIDAKGVYFSVLTKKHYIAFSEIAEIHIINGLGRFVLIIASHNGEHIVLSSLFSNFKTYLEHLKPHANDAERNALDNAIILLKKQFFSYIFCMLIIVALLIYIIIRGKATLWNM